MTIPILKITDGTTEISLIQEGGNAFYLESWRPKVAQFKGGGTFQQSSMSGGRQLVDYQYKNVIESFNLKIADVDPDSLIRQTQELRRLLIKAADYWATEWQDEPVWIEARAANETNTRYAIIHSYSTPDDENPFGQPFLQDRNSAVMDAWTLSIERGHWMDNDPTDSDCVEVSGLQDEPYRSDVFVPTSSLDDARVDHNLSTISTAGTTLLFGNNGLGAQDLGVRFRSVTVPSGATIISAFVRFTCATSRSSTTVNAIVKGEDSVTPDVFSTYVDFTGRSRTAETVDWDAVAAWVAGTTYDTPDISDVVQEIIDLGSWASGNNLVIFVEDNGSGSAMREPASWDNVTYDEAELHITWTAPPAYGRAATCTDEVFVAPKQNQRNLTHIFVDDGGVFGPNLLTSDPPYALLPAVPAVNDAVYFGIERGALEEFIFASLIFDIGAAGSGYTIDWEYWQGGGPGWTDMVAELDRTDSGGGLAFGNTGVNNVSWSPNLQTNWDPTAINGVTAWWVRANVASIPAALTAPTQQNRHVYTVTWPYVELSADDSGGDIPPLIQVNVINRYATGANPISFVASGLRSVDRGESFQAYLNLSDQQQPGFISVTLGTDTAWQDDILAPTGRSIAWGATAPNLDTWVTLCNINIDAAMSSEFFGIYHCYLRISQPTGAVGQMKARVQFQFGENVYATTEEKAPLVAAFTSILSMGEIAIPGAKLAPSDVAETFQINVQGSASVVAATAHMHLIDLILIPVDEWAGDFLDASLTNNYGVEEGERLEIDSLAEKWMIRSLHREPTDDMVVSVFRDKANGPAILTPRKRQRLYFLFGETLPDGTSGVSAAFQRLVNVQMFKNQRYLSMRGDR